jgi:hypothetical protein
MENDSVEFYSHMRSMLGPQDAPALEAIIKEEQIHAQDLKFARRHLA